MKFVANTRHDGPVQSDAVEVRPSAGLAQAPQRLPRNQVVKPLLDANDELARFDAETTAKRAALEQKRLSALDAQDRVDELRKSIPPLEGHVERSKQFLEDFKVRREQVIRNLRGCWWMPSAREHLTELAEKTALIELLPGWIKEDESELTSAKSELAQLQKRYGLSE